MTRDNPLIFRIGNTRFSLVDELGILILLIVIGIPAIVVGLGWLYVLSMSGGYLQIAGVLVLIIPSLWVIVMALNILIALLTGVRNILENILGLALWIVTLGKWGND